jgi:hypothetical protein
MEPICYVAIPGNKPGLRIGIVKYRESGYYQTDLDRPSLTETQVKIEVAQHNRNLGLPEDVSEAMFAGSMFGWDVSGALRANQWATTHPTKEDDESGQ